MATTGLHPNIHGHETPPQGNSSEKKEQKGKGKLQREVDEMRVKFQNTIESFAQQNNKKLDDKEFKDLQDFFFRINLLPEDAKKSPENFPALKKQLIELLERVQDTQQSKVFERQLAHVYLVLGSDEDLKQAAGLLPGLLENAKNPDEKLEILSSLAFLSRQDRTKYEEYVKQINPLLTKANLDNIDPRGKYAVLKYVQESGTHPEQIKNIELVLKEAKDAQWMDNESAQLHLTRGKIYSSLNGEEQSAVGLKPGEDAKKKAAEEAFTTAQKELTRMTYEPTKKKLEEEIVGALHALNPTHQKEQGKQDKPEGEKHSASAEGHKDKEGETEKHKEAMGEEHKKEGHEGEQTEEKEGEKKEAKKTWFGKRVFLWLKDKYTKAKKLIKDFLQFLITPPEKEEKTSGRGSGHH